MTLSTAAWMKFFFKLFLLLLAAAAAESRSPPPLPLPSQQQLSFSSPEHLSSYVVSNGRLFVGGTNHLYQLSPRDLSVVRHVQTGPRLDSPSCHASGCSDNSTAKLTDNVNKLLLVDEENGKLIACGSLFQVRAEKIKSYPFSNLPLT